jgi:formate dehydrogenase iron-sulfur subunit
MTLPADNLTKPAPAIGERTLVDTLLDEQRRLTAVEAFARAHERHELTESRYRKLLPVSAPRPGEQYAFEVDLDQCSGCKACVTACHSLNGLDDGEAWREVGALFGEALVPVGRNSVEPHLERSEASAASISGEAARLQATRSARAASVGKWGSTESHPTDLGFRLVPLHQTVTTACHHCVEPGCLLGCPVLAYDKDPLTGIVRHLDDQCIGCSYCILKCPYDVPKYSAKRGIVRKCDLCHGRLAAGEAPACVHACPNEAIRISVVSLAEVKAMSRSASRSASEKVEKWESETVSASLSHSLTLSPAHLSASWLPDSPSPHITLPTTRYVSAKPAGDLRAADHNQPRPQPAHWPLLFMLVLLFAGLTASVFHLGQPLKAWRIWLGWRTSWLSREAIALNAFAGAAVTGVAAHWLPTLTNHYSLITFPLCALGLAAVFAQAMVYADTHRAFWSLRHTAPRFFGSAVVLGIGLALAFQPSAPLAVALLLVTLLKLACELAVLKHADTDSDRWTQLRRTAALQTGALRPVLALRLLTALVGGVFLPFTIATSAAVTALTVSAFVLCLLGELAERHLFFTSVAPDKMPV